MYTDNGEIEALEGHTVPLYLYGYGLTNGTQVVFTSAQGNLSYLFLILGFSTMFPKRDTVGKYCISDKILLKMNSTVFVKKWSAWEPKQRKIIEKKLKPTGFEPGPNYTLVQ